MTSNRKRLLSGIGAAVIAVGVIIILTVSIVHGGPIGLVRPTATNTPAPTPTITPWSSPTTMLTPSPTPRPTPSPTPTHVGGSGPDPSWPPVEANDIV